MIRDDSKQVLLSVFGIALLIVAVVGISYAVFTFTSKSITKNTVRSGGITFQYLESNNVIQIDNAMPVSDQVGMNQNDSFDFHVSSTIRGDADVLYEIRAKSIPVSNPLDNRFVKMYLEKEKDGQYQTVLSPTTFRIDSNTSLMNDAVDLDTMLLYSGKFNGQKGSKLFYNEAFRFKMWVDSNYSLDNVSRSFKVKISVYASM